MTTGGPGSVQGVVASRSTRSLLSSARRETGRFRDVLTHFLTVFRRGRTLT